MALRFSASSCVTSARASNTNSSIVNRCYYSKTAGSLGSVSLTGSQPGFPGVNKWMRSHGPKHSFPPRPVPVALATSRTAACWSSCHSPGLPSWLPPVDCKATKPNQTSKLQIGPNTKENLVRRPSRIQQNTITDCLGGPLTFHCFHDRLARKPISTCCNYICHHGLYSLEMILTLLPKCTEGL